MEATIREEYQTAFEKLEKQLEKNPTNADLLKKKEQLEAHLNDINKALCDIGNGGGHEHMAGGFISYDKLERKDAAGIREIIKNRFMSEVNKVNK